MKKLLLLLPLLMTGCATFNHKLTDWDDGSRFKTADEQELQIVGNPRITCYRNDREEQSRVGHPVEKVVADGLFVKLDKLDYRDGAYVVVDEFGKDYVYVWSRSDAYCVLWKK